MNPYELEARDKNPFYVLDAEIEARIKDVVYDAVDYDNATRCTLTFDNGYRVMGVADRHRDEIAETMAFRRAMEHARDCFEFQRAERLQWMEQQVRESGVLAATGQHGGL